VYTLEGMCVCFIAGASMPYPRVSQALYLPLDRSPPYPFCRSGDQSRRTTPTLAPNNQSFLAFQSALYNLGCGFLIPELYLAGSEDFPP
jgi:hypothetical protein